MGSILVLDQKLTGQEGMYLKIPFSFKSFFFTYLRVAIVLLGIAAPFYANSLEEGPRKFGQRRQQRANYTWLKIGGPVAAIVLFWLSRRLTHASHQRALQLADLAGLDRAVIYSVFAERGHPIEFVAEDEQMVPVNQQGTSSKKSRGHDDDDVFRLE